MRTAFLITVFGVMASVAVAQQPAGSLKTYASAADVAAMIAKAKSERKPDQANFIQTILQDPPYAAHLEYRVAGVDAPATVHETEAEMFYVIEGAATLTTGGKLKDEKRSNPTNLSGSGIEGGTARKVAKGDFFLVPKATPHGFSGIDGTLVLMTLHVPQPAK